MSDSAVPLRVLYTAEATVTGGRRGHGATSDGRLTVDFSAPTEMGGDGGPGTNPEQLFALGYAACWQNAMIGIARRKGLDVLDSVVTARVGIGLIEAGRLGLAVELLIIAPVHHRSRPGQGAYRRGRTAVPLLQRRPRQRRSDPHAALSPLNGQVTLRSHAILEWVSGW